jgi:hypothetical protein
MKRDSIDFRGIAAAALPHLPTLVSRWLPGGRRQGKEWLARNPRRSDERIGSFKINLTTGKWADFATGDKGGDAISLAAYLFGVSQKEAAIRIADMLALGKETRHGR